MTHEHKQAPPIIGLIDQDDLEALNARDENDPRLLALRERLGEVAENAVAILYSDDPEMSVKYVVVGRDRGTTISKFESHGLPEPIEVVREIQARADAEQDSPHEALDTGLESFSAALIEQLESAKPVADFVDAAIETSRATATAMAEVEDLWKQMKYNGGINGANVSDMASMLQGIRQRIMGDHEPAMTAIVQLNAINAELEGMQHDPVLETEATDERDEVWYALRKTEEGLSEASMQLRSTTGLQEEIDGRLTKVIRVLEEMLQDSWGREAYMAQISAYLNELVSDPYLQPYVTLSRAQSALEDVTRIKARLISKE